MRLAAAFAFMLGCFGLLVWSWQWQTQQGAATPQTVERPFPSLIRLPHMPVDAPYDPQAVQLVNIFASWCTPCIAELPYLDQIREQSGAPVIGVAWNDTAEQLDPWLEKYGNPFDVIYLDERGVIGQALGIGGLPETYVLGAGGQIVTRHRGPITAQDVPDYVKKLKALRREAGRL